MLQIDQVKEFVGVVHDTYVMGEVDTTEPVDFLAQAVEALMHALTVNHDGESILNEFAQEHLHLGQS